MGTNYQIGLAGARHVSAIPGIELAAAQLFSESDLPEPIRYRVTDKTHLYAAQVEKRLWLATTVDDLPVGFALVAELDGNAHLDELSVQPAHGRRGLGTRLLATVQSWAVVEGYAYLSLVTFAHVPWNAPFYAKYGFEQMPSTTYGKDLEELFAEERAAGINVDKRIAMRLAL